MTPSAEQLAAVRLHLEIRKHERAGVPFARACRLVGEQAGVDPFSVRAAVVKYRESLGGPAAPSLSAAEYAEILTSGDILAAIFAAFNSGDRGA